MVKRIVNDLEIELDEREANEIYLPQSFIDSLTNFDGELEAIKEGIYSWKRNTEYIPLSIFWELTNKCNFSCPFCYINSPKAKNYSPIYFSEAKRVIDELVKLGMVFCTFSGGECLLDPDFKEIYMYTKKKGVLASVFTNGYLINDDIINLFKSYKPYKVEISIYGMTEKGFQRATNSNYDYKRVLENILLLKKAGIWVRCKTPITNLTSSEILFIKGWCEEHEIDYYASDELLPTYEGESVDEYKIQDTVYEQVANNKIVNLRKRRSKEFNCKRAWDCSAGKYSGVISANKNFYPCMSSVGIEKYSFSMVNGIGNAIAEFKNILQIEKGKKLSFCSGCEWCDICEKCVLSLLKDSKDDLYKNCITIREI